MKRKNNDGIITLEACVTVLSFLVLMFLLAGMFVMFMAQNVTSHVVLQTSQSLSLDAYSMEKFAVPEGTIGNVGNYVGQFVVNLFGSSENNPSFVTDNSWKKDDPIKIARAAKTKFVGYLTGGDEEEADEFLRNLNVVNGLDGLDFTSSYVENDVLYLVLKYELEYDLNVWKVDNVQVRQTVRSKLWR